MAKDLQLSQIIDSIKVLEDPTKSTGAVTFVDIPPGMPTVVSKLEKVPTNCNCRKYNLFQL